MEWRASLKAGSFAAAPSSRTIIGSDLKLATMRNDIENRPSNDYEPFRREALDQSIGARFDEIARHFPDKLAVRTKQHSWSYAELNARAEKLAEAINAHEISRPAPISLLFDHDAPAIAAVLGVLKAGHFYCALEPAAPLAQRS